MLGLYLSDPEFANGFWLHNAFMPHFCLSESVNAIGVHMIWHPNAAVKALVLEMVPHWILNPGRH